jgi:hypothetical protein
MKRNILLIPMAMMLWGLLFSGPATADNPSTKQVVFYVQ